MSKSVDLLNRFNASEDPDERLRLADEALAQALAWNETGEIAVFAKLAGSTCEALGRFERAVHYFELIPLHVGNDAFTYLTLGILYLQLGKREEGLLRFKRCYQTASTKKGQKKVLEFLNQELRLRNLTLSDLGV